jgi:hypothetical protein
MIIPHFRLTNCNIIIFSTHDATLKMKLDPHIVVRERTLTLDRKKERREKKNSLEREQRRVLRSACTSCLVVILNLASLLVSSSAGAQSSFW